MIEFFLAQPQDTDLLGQWLAATRPPHAVGELRGNLGAGKSTLARALLRALGVQGNVRSPTYTLVERYPLAEGEAVHLDLYRIAAPGELEFLGLDELRGARLWLVEWPERGGQALPPADLEIGLSVRDEGRLAELTESSEKGRDWLASFSKIAGSSTSV
jgi:tRNA threonylcarbamoyladenosine biosynthesis protein TsaE